MCPQELVCSEVEYMSRHSVPYPVQIYLLISIPLFEGAAPNTALL